jgi:hypothetical protein
MIRKLLVVIISMVYISLGLWNLGDFFFPILFPSALIVYKLFPLVGGTLGLIAGLNLLRLNEFGRKFVLLLLYIRMAINTFAIIWIILIQGPNNTFALTFFGKAFFKSGNHFIGAGIMFAWLVIALLTAAFLSHHETKKIFALAIVDNVDSNDKNSDNIESEILI